MPQNHITQKAPKEPLPVATGKERSDAARGSHIVKLRTEGVRAKNSHPHPFNPHSTIHTPPKQIRAVWQPLTRQPEHVWLANENTLVGLPDGSSKTLTILANAR